MGLPTVKVVAATLETIHNISNVTNLVSNAGVVATDTTGVGTSRRDLAAAGYSSTA